MSYDETRNVAEESVSQHSKLDTPSSDGLVDFLSEESFSAAPEPSPAPQSPASQLAEPPDRVAGPSDEGSGQFENEDHCNDTVVASTDADSARDPGRGGQLAAVLAAILVCSIAAGTLRLHDVRSTDRELTTLPSSSGLEQAQKPAPETSGTPIIDPTENNDTQAAVQSVVSASDDQESEMPGARPGAGSPAEGLPFTRMVSATIPVEGTSVSGVVSTTNRAAVAAAPRGMSATTAADRVPSARAMSATIAPTSGRPDAGSTSRVATVESGGVLTAPLPGAITPVRAAISDVGSAASDDDRLSIERTLERYQRAYRELDAPAAAALWPTVDARALKRAFSSVQEQDLVFRSCDIATSPEAATVHCVGDLTYVRRVGDTTRRAERHTWTIQLLRSGREWSVVGLSAH
jgi:hypothetical protein